MHRELLVSDDLVAHGKPGYKPPPEVFDEASPLRRAIRAHFESYEGLTEPAPQIQDRPEGLDGEMHIYKDTSSGAQV